MQETRTVRVGVFGVGRLGGFHTRIYSELPEVELVGIYDTDAARAAEVAEEYGTKVWTDPAALMDAVEAASVVVPTDRHLEVAGPMLKRGLHLLVEKPIAASLEEAEELVTLAQEHDAILQVGHVERFNPVLGFLENLEQHPRFIEAHRLASYPPPRPGLHPRGTEVSVVLDLMIHDIEILLHLVGSPVKQFDAVGVPVLSPTSDIANVRLTFENGCVANLTASRISPERMRKIRVFYSDRYVSLDYQEQSGSMYVHKDGTIVPEEVPINKGEPLLLELQSFVNCVLGRDQLVVSGEHASEALKIAVAITRELREADS